MSNLMATEDRNSKVKSCLSLYDLFTVMTTWKGICSPSQVSMLPAMGLRNCTRKPVVAGCF